MNVILKNKGEFYQSGDYQVNPGALYEFPPEKAKQLLSDFPQNWEIVGREPENRVEVEAVKARPLPEDLKEHSVHRSTIPYPVDLIVVTHNSEKDIERFLMSLKQSTGVNFNLIIVDSNSKDKTKERIRGVCGAHYPSKHGAQKWKLVCLKKNAGYAAACNRGAKERCYRNKQGAVMVFLNADMEFPEYGWLEKVCETLEDKKVGIAGAKILGADGVYQPSGLDNWVCGCCIGVRRKVFAELGGFDEFYFFMWEETDLCMTATRKGYKVVETDAKVKHYYVKKPTEFFSEHYERGRRYFNKKFGTNYK